MTAVESVATTAEDALASLGVLADPQRRQILLNLAPQDACTCTDLVGELQLSQPTISHHLKVLRDAGLVVGERCGRYVNYAIVPERLREIAAALEGIAGGVEARAQ